MNDSQQKPRYDPKYKKFRVVTYVLFSGLIAYVVVGLTWSILKYLLWHTP